MHRVPADYVSLFLRSLSWASEETGVSLGDLLKSYAKAKLASTGEGLSLIGTAADGSSVSYALPAPTVGLTLTPESLAMMIGRLLDWVDEIKEGDDEATDAEILAELRARAKPVRSFRCNFRQGNY